ncbi:MAG: hypothetical protein JRN52_11285 [Nitrososphaerota archaeon]|nr:hypothetical protein [Nitrososphaerota archaeon]
MTLLVCDTDFLMKVTNEPIPKLHQLLESSEYDLVTLPSVRRELAGLSRSSNQKTARYARNAIRAIENKTVRVLQESSGAKTDADVALLDFGHKHAGSALVATLDGELLSEMESRGISYLTIRNNRPFRQEFARATYLTTKKREN